MTSALEARSRASGDTAIEFPMVLIWSTRRRETSHRFGLERAEGVRAGPAAQELIHLARERPRVDRAR